jgi:hypothetical protein
LFCRHFHHHHSTIAILLPFVPSYFCHHRLLLLTFSCPFSPSPPSLAYFFHCHLFSPLSLAPTSLFPLASTITTSSSTSFVRLPYCLLVWVLSSPSLLSTSSPFYLCKRWSVGSTSTTSNFYFFIFIFIFK